MTEILREGDLTLVPDDDREYLSKLMRASPYNPLNDRGIARYVKFVRYLWEGHAKNIAVVGVIYFCFIPGVGWTFDAYDERKKLKKLDNKGQWAYRASCLVLDWFARKQISDEVFAVIDQENRGAIIMAKKLGFVFQKNTNGMVVLRKGV